MADETNIDRADQRWVGLAVGLSVMGAVSLIGLLFYLLRKVSRDQPQAPSQQIYMVCGGGGCAPSVGIPSAHGRMHGNMGGPFMDLQRQIGSPELINLAPQRVFSNTPDGSMLAQQPLMHTYALTPLSDPNTEPTRLAQASNTAYDVTLSVVGPTGAYAAFSMEPNELMTGDLFPTGNTLILPTCETRIIRLLPKQAIYAKGQAINPGDIVYATATANEAGVRIYS